MLNVNAMWIFTEQLLFITGCYGEKVYSVGNALFTSKREKNPR